MISYHMEQMCADTIGTVPVLAHTINPCVKCTTQMMVLITKTFQNKAEFIIVVHSQ